jgi:hypothetical protein
VLFEMGKSGGETFKLLLFDIAIFKNPPVRHTRLDTTLVNAMGDPERISDFSRDFIF